MARRSGINRRQLIVVGAAAGSALAGGTILSQLPTNPPSNAQPSTTKAQVNSNGQFANRVVLITGATSGIGEATARAFAREGAIVHFCGRRAQLGSSIAKEITSQGGRASYQRADVRNEQDVRSFVNTAVQKYGRIDIAFNNAGIASCN